MSGDVTVRRCPECGRYMKPQTRIEADGSGPTTTYSCTNPTDEGADYER